MAIFSAISPFSSDSESEISVQEVTVSEDDISESSTDSLSSFSTITLESDSESSTYIHYSSSEHVSLEETSVTCSQPSLAANSGDRQSSSELEDGANFNLNAAPSTIVRRVTQTEQLGYSRLEYPAGISTATRNVRFKWRRRAGYNMLYYGLKYGLRLILLKRQYRRRKLLEGRGSSTSQSNVTVAFKFSELPVEIIMEIVDFCDYNSLQCLTATSRFMSEIAFPPFWNKSGLCLPQPDSLRPGAHAPYGVLDIMTLRQARALCVWKRQKSFHPISILNFMLELPADQIAILIDLSLAFFGSSMPFSAPFSRMISIYISSLRNIDAETCRLVYGLQHSGCSTLTITGFNSFRDQSREETSTVSQIMVPTEAGFDRLRTFRSCGSLPFLAPLLTFTLHNILSERLRVLDLSASDFSIGKWARFLRYLSLPLLEILTLCGSISLVSLLKFLRRHRLLKSITLNGVDVPFHSPSLPRGFSLSLSDLTFISAPALYLGEILKYIRQASILTHVAVRTDTFEKSFSISINEIYRRSSVVSLFHQVKRFPSISHVEFHFSRSDSTEFCEISQDQDLTPPETLLLFVQTLGFRKSSGLPFGNEALAKTIGWAARFPSLTTFELWENGGSNHDEWASALYSKDIVPIIRNFRY